MTDTTEDRYLVQAHLPDDAKLAVYGAGKVRHVMNARSKGTWCGMFYANTNLRPATADDVNKTICGACLRTLPAVLARRKGSE